MNLDGMQLLVFGGLMKRNASIPAFRSKQANVLGNVGGGCSAVCVSAPVFVAKKSTEMAIAVSCARSSSSIAIAIAIREQKSTDL
jgi:hypothetical protein